MADGEFDLTPYGEMVEQMLTDVGLDPDECYIADGDYWTATKGSAHIYIGFFHIHYDDGTVDWYMYTTGFLREIPAENREKFYLRLLQEAADRVGVKFYVKDNEAWVEIARELEGLSITEASRNLNRVANTADELDDILRAEFA